MNIKQGSGRARGFSLIELMVVIGIIALIVAIVVPALGHAKDSAKKEETRNLCQNVMQACITFQQSEGRLPGYFSAKAMGSAANATRGFSAMQNAMLELTGVALRDTGNPAAGEVKVGPTTTDTVILDPHLMGAATPSGKAYFTPPGKFFKPLDRTTLPTGGRVSYAWCDSNPTTDAQTYFNEMIDSYGNPILLWAIDSATRGEVLAPNIAQNNFAQITSANPARFYWNSNASFLDDGDGTTGMYFYGSVPPLQTTNSLLKSNNDDLKRRALMALLGNPASPKAVTDAAGAPLPVDQILPSAARGQVVVHSSGRDRTFLSKNDRGGKQTTGGALHYGTSVLPDASGKTQDVISLFDDIIISGG
jgi:prepilin-type N-terminal cleavage/methylation domain-containing protein